MNDIEALARVRDDDLAMGPAARQLLTVVTSERLAEPPRRRRWAVALATLTAAVVAFGLSFGTGSTSYASSAIEVHKDGDFFVARIKDPLADHEAYRKAFDAVGLDVDIRLVPVPPQRVGQILGTDNRGSGTVVTELIGTVDCRNEPRACQLEIRVSADTGGPVRYTFGRAAQPGESYQEPLQPPR